MPPEHRVAAGDQRSTYEAQVRSALAGLLSKHCLVVDEHPTYTRFFTFASIFGKLLTLCLLGIQRHVLQLVSVVPRKENTVRLRKVLFFTGLPGALDYMKRTSLALDVATHTHSICAKADSAQTPVLVQLAQGLVRTSVTEDFVNKASSLHLDPALDKGAALTVLHSAVADTLARFRLVAVLVHHAVGHVVATLDGTQRLFRLARLVFCLGLAPPATSEAARRAAFRVPLAVATTFPCQA